MNRAEKRRQKKLAKKALKNKGHLGPHPQAIPEFAIAVQHHQEGRLSEAETLYRSILAVEEEHLSCLHNLGVLLNGKGESVEAEALFRKALTLKPDYAQAYDSLGVALFQMKRLDEAVDAFRQSLSLNTGNPQAHFNLGNALKDKGLRDEANACYREALTLSPDDFNILNNLSALLLEQSRPEEAIACLARIIEMAPGFPEGHFNMGNACKDLGRYEEAIKYYCRAIELNPDFETAWGNLRIVVKLAKFQDPLGYPSVEPILTRLGEINRSNRNLVLYHYVLDSYRPHEADASFDRVLALTPGPQGIRQAADILPGPPIALLHFGRSGTGLMHSLIDNHPEISTLPSIFLGGYFNDGVWEDLSSDDVDRLPERFVDKFEVLFDAASPKPIPSSEPDGLSMIGFKEGMTNLGESRNKVLTVDRQAFCEEARRLLKLSPDIDAGRFLRIVHASYEKAIGTESEKNTLFYHIHNPNLGAWFNFLKNLPDARIMMMVREPVQSCESWLKEYAHSLDFQKVTLRITQMLFDIDKVPFRRRDSVGVRLEDLKARPKETLPALCRWIGIEEAPSLYDMTARGEKWWGDPTSPDYDSQKEMSPFDDVCLKRKPGSIFSEQDRFLLETLYYPFSVRFGYREENQAEFKSSLKQARGLLSGLLDFEKKIIEQSGLNSDRLRQSEDFLTFRAALTDRLDVLEAFGTYPHMLAPLRI